MNSECLTQLMVGGGVEYVIFLEIMMHLSILGGITIVALLIQKAERIYFH